MDVNAHKHGVKNEQSNICFWKTDGERILDRGEVRIPRQFMKLLLPLRLLKR